MEEFLGKEKENREKRSGWEKWRKRKERKEKYVDDISDLGKSQKYRKCWKIGLIRKGLEKFLKIVNIILRYMMETVFRNKITFSN